MIGRALFFAREIFELGREVFRFFKTEVLQRTKRDNIELVNGITIETRGAGRLLFAGDFGADKITRFKPSDLGAGWRNVSALAAYRLNQFLKSIPYKTGINSAWRSPEHNKSVGGASNSKHLTGEAFDIEIQDPKFFQRDRLNLYVDLARQAGFNGVGLYEGKKIVHVDIRQRLSSWAGISQNGTIKYIALADFLKRFAPIGAGLIIMGALIFLLANRTRLT